MNKIYDDAKDKNVATVVLYADANKDLYYDVNGTEAVKAADCLELFIKGVVCIYDGDYYKALSCTEEGVINFGFPTKESDSPDVAG